MQVLKQAYYIPEEPGSFGGVRALEDGIKGRKPSISFIKEWLSNQNTYTIHKPLRKRFPRNRVMAFSIDDLWQADLVDMSDYAKYNKKFRYLLTVIDVFSKYAWVRPLRRKLPAEVAKAFESIFREGRICRNLQTDMGGEFHNKLLAKLFKKNKINYYVSYSEMKCPVVERFNRTLKERMWRYFTARNTYKYIDIIQKLVKGYVHKKHRSIGMAPNEVNASTAADVYFKLYGDLTKS